MAHEWFLKTDDDVLGPLSATELKKMVAAGTITTDTRVRKGTDGKWLKAGRIRGLLNQPAPASQDSVQQSDSTTSPMPSGQQPDCERGEFDLTLKVKHSHGSESDVNRYVDELGTLVPSTESAYVPSGKFPDGAASVMGKGAALSYPAGLAAGLATAAIAFPLLSMFMIMATAVMLMLIRQNSAERIPDEFRWVVAVMAPVLVYMVTGICSAHLVSRYGRKARNRNVQAAVCFSLLSAFGAALTLPFIMRGALGLPTDWDGEGFFTCSFPDCLASVEGVVANTSLAGILWSVLALTITGFAAAISAIADVRGFKYCERCDEPMEASQLPNLTLGGGQALIDAVDRNDLQRVLNLFGEAKGGDCTCSLFICPNCRCSYFESSLSCDLKYKKGDQKQTQPVAWLIVSRGCTPEETACFDPHIVNQPES